MDHAEIRFRILHTLYQKHYGGYLLRTIETNEIIDESGLESLDKDLVFGDIVYLKGRELIEGLSQLGVAYPTEIRITTDGIDVMENAINQSLHELDKDTKLEKTELVQIKKETSPAKRTERLWNYAKEHPDLIVSIVGIFAKIIGIPSA